MKRAGGIATTGPVLCNSPLKIVSLCYNMALILLKDKAKGDCL